MTTLKLILFILGLLVLFTIVGAIVMTLITLAFGDLIGTSLACAFTGGESCKKKNDEQKN
mgnify:CR=1 FL=1